MVTEIIEDNSKSNSKRTVVGDLLKLMNSEYGQLTLGLRTTSLMDVAMILFAVFLSII